MTKHIPLKNTIPVRSCKKNYKSYNSYRKHLEKDFTYECGYCGEPQFEGHSFHIDHFAPKRKFPLLTTTYSNLVLSCSICNMGKGDDWISTKSDIPNNGQEGYIDPCDPEYNMQFARTKSGEIIPTTSLGKYMYDKFKFSLKRRAILWRLMYIENLLNQIDDLMQNKELSQTDETCLLRQHHDLSNIFRSDWKSLFYKG